MIVRALKQNDIERMKELITNDNPLTDFEAAVAVEKDSKLLAFGVNRKMLEAVLYCDGSKKDRAESLRILIKAGIDDAKRQGMKRLHAFVNEEFYKVMNKSFGFEKTSNICVYLDLE
jgi:hypothetical protein